MSDAALEGRLCRLRPLRLDDAAALCAVANDFLVARWMTRAFPHPYTKADADRWIAHALEAPPERYYAIEVENAFTGGIGVEPYGGERTGSAAFGYWLGRAFWGRGIATDAAQVLAAHALRAGGLRRLEARVFAPNVASARVLQKAGFIKEAQLRAFYLDRDDRVCDAMLFARVTEP